MVAFLVPSPQLKAVAGISLKDAIFSNGLSSSIAWIIDAGDKESYPGTGQAVYDRSGNGRDFTRGDPSVSETHQDPPFVGTAGLQSSGEYFSCSVTAGQHLRRDTLADAWANAAHKQNALFTWCGYRYVPDPSDLGIVFIDTCRSVATNPGFVIYLDDNDTGTPDQFTFDIATGTVFEGWSSGLTPTFSAWQFFAMSYNESTGAWIMQINGTQATGTQTYSAPSASNIVADPILGTFAGGSSVTGRQSSDAWWTRALSAGELTTLYNASKGRYGL